MMAILWLDQSNELSRKEIRAMLHEHGLPMRDFSTYRPKNKPLYMTRTKRFLNRVNWAFAGGLLIMLASACVTVCLIVALIGWAK